MRRIAGSLLTAAVLLGGLARAQDDDALPVTGDAAADLAKALDAWDHRDEGAFTNTIPFEKAVLRAAAEAKPEAVVAHVTHERYGALLFAALCERRPAGPAATKLVDAFAAMEPSRRAETAISFAALGTDGVRSELRALASIDAFLSSGPPREAILAALVRAGDPSAVAEVRSGLASKDADEVARALLRVGDARATGFLADVARLADDPRKLATPGESQWPGTRTATSADGLSTTTETVPVALATVGEAAVESANRMAASTLPGWVVWWYEIEKGPRFGRGAEAVKLLRPLVAEEARAAKAKALSAHAAVAAVVAAVRPKADAMAEWKLVSVAFDRVWTVAYTLGDAAGSATVDAAGKVTLR